MTIYASTNTHRHTPTPTKAHATSSWFEPTRRNDEASSAYLAFSGVLVWHVNMNMYNVCEHNLEAHFLCNRTGAFRQAEWSSHLRKTQDAIFSKQWLKSIRRLSLHTVLYRCPQQHTHIHTPSPTNTLALQKHNFKESFPERFPEFPVSWPTLSAWTKVKL